MLEYDSDVGNSVKLLAIKKRMLNWLWKACIRALKNADKVDFPDVLGLYGRAMDREVPMHAALAAAHKYPPRPPMVLSSPSVDRLRAGSPRHRGTMDGVQLDGRSTTRTLWYEPVQARWIDMGSHWPDASPRSKSLIRGWKYNEMLPYRSPENWPPVVNDTDTRSGTLT
ncbi:hypothetical protein BN946_scf184970.g91 [Trametes cinnabarina]|uniref:Uncharacterized protein n=1 Tax=Pycnoporus cinnabarinus TaxID=5643 RepID=A0A060SJ47_PYCCI|nr:hypothetical protein BN946_scf184970.g91 [Trametes cinnabarina]